MALVHLVSNKVAAAYARSDLFDRRRRPMADLAAPVSSMVAMAPKRAPVSARALSTTSVSTVSRSRLALMRRLAALSAEIPRCGSSGALTAAPRPGAESVCRRRTRAGPGRSGSNGKRWNT